MPIGRIDKVTKEQFRYVFLLPAEQLSILSPEPLSSVNTNMSLKVIFMICDRIYTLKNNTDYNL